MARRKKISAQLGVWSYIAGVVIALLVSLFSDGALDVRAVGILTILGLVVGLVNIGDREVVLYLAAGIAFIVAAGAMEATFSRMGLRFTTFELLMRAIIVFTAPGLLVVSFKAMYEVAKES